MCMIIYYRDLKVLWFICLVVTQRKNPPPHKEKMDLISESPVRPLFFVFHPLIPYEVLRALVGALTGIKKALAGLCVLVDFFVILDGYGYIFSTLKFQNLLPVHVLKIQIIITFNVKNDLYRSFLCRNHDLVPPSCIMAVCQLFITIVIAIIILINV